MNQLYRIDMEKTVWRLIDGEIVILNLDSGHHYSLNKAGSLVWQLLNKNRTPPQIIEKMAQAYNISQEVAQEDVMSVLASLKKEGLVF